MRFDLDDVDDGPPDELGAQSPRWGAVLVVAVLIAAATSALLYYASRGAAPAGCTVPALVGLTETEARIAAEGARLVFEVRERVDDPLVPRGAVAWQRPLAGAQVAPFTPVRVKISKGLPGSGGDRNPRRH